MSAALSYARPHRPGAPVAAPAPRHVEIVTTRAQRRARPKSFYAVVAVLCVFALFLAQLMLSILLSDGAYQISTLQAEQKSLGRTEQALAEQLDVLSSPQSLASKAEALGMVVGNSAPAFLRLSDSGLSGTLTPASGTAGPIAQNGGLVGNALLTQQPATPTETGTTPTTGAPTVNADATSVPSNSGALPSPVTR